MTDAVAATTHSQPPKDGKNAEDAKLAELGYTQKLDRSVGTLASFAIGFATISATTADTATISTTTFASRAVCTTLSAKAC